MVNRLSASFAMGILIALAWSPTVSAQTSTLRNSGQGSMAYSHAVAFWESMVRVGSRMLDASMYSEAEAQFRMALRLAEDNFPVGDDRVAETLHGLGQAVENQPGKDNFHKAMVLHERAFTMRENQSDVDPARIAESLGIMGHNATRSGDHNKAIEYLSRAVTIDETLIPRHFANITSELMDMSYSYTCLNRHAEIVPHYKRVQDILERKLSPGNALIAANLNYLGVELDRLGDYHEAERLLRLAVDARQKLGPASRHDLALSLAHLSGVMHAQGKNREAEELARKSIILIEAVKDQTDPSLIEPLAILGSISVIRSDVDDAVAKFSRMHELLERFPRWYGPHVDQAVESYMNIIRKRPQQRKDSERLASLKFFLNSKPHRVITNR